MMAKNIYAIENVLLLKAMLWKGFKLTVTTSHNINKKL